MRIINIIYYMKWKMRIIIFDWWMKIIEMKNEDYNIWMKRFNIWYYYIWNELNENEIRNEWNINKMMIWNRD
jgi:hypothetical protein